MDGEFWKLNTNIIELSQQVQSAKGPRDHQNYTDNCKFIHGFHIRSYDNC